MTQLYIARLRALRAVDEMLDAIGGQYRTAQAVLPYMQLLSAPEDQHVSTQAGSAHLRARVPHTPRSPCTVRLPYLCPTTPAISPPPPFPLPLTSSVVLPLNPPCPPRPRFGPTVSRLQDRGVLDNTYVIYTSDNGFHMGQHSLYRGKVGIGRCGCWSQQPT